MVRQHHLLMRTEVVEGVVVVVIVVGRAGLARQAKGTLVGQGLIQQQRMSVAVAVVAVPEQLDQMRLLASEVTGVTVLRPGLRVRRSIVVVAAAVRRETLLRRRSGRAA